jgi:hypothetical protein
MPLLAQIVSFTLLAIKHIPSHIEGSMDAAFGPNSLFHTTYNNTLPQISYPRSFLIANLHTRGIQKSRVTILDVWHF